MISVARLHMKGWSHAEIKKYQQHRARHHKYHSVLTHDAEIMTFFVILSGLTTFVIYFLSGALYTVLMHWVWPYFVFFLSLVLGFLFQPLAHHFLLPNYQHLRSIILFSLGWHVGLAISIVPILVPDAPGYPLLILTGLIGGLGFVTPLLTSLKRHSYFPKTKR